MPGPFEYIVWFVGLVLEAAVVVCAIQKGAFRRYLLLNVYMAASFAVNLGRFRILTHYGLTSSEYLYFYYYSDALLTVLLYFALSSLYAHIFSELNAEKYVRLLAILLLAGTALFSYAVVQQSSARLVTHFVVELSQNLYFVGLVLTYILWGAILKLRETRTRLVQLVLALGIHFSLLAANFALGNLYPSAGVICVILIPIVGCFLPFAWTYAFWRTPEESRLAPARLSVVPR